MVSQFRNHPRKNYLRKNWDTPLLEKLYSIWNSKFFYCGLPGPQILDIKLWKSMIDRVVAFELECDGDDPRKNIAALSRNLTLCNLSHNVYCGTMEEVVLDKEDIDGKVLDIDKLVTLFNLDFCNRISGRIDTPKGRRCRRYEAIREIISIQRRIYRRTRETKFIILLTVLDSYHNREMQQFLSDSDLLPTVKEYAEKVVQDKTPEQYEGFYYHTELLKVYVFYWLRQCLRSNNIKSIFLPPISYVGTSFRSPMLHFAVICSLEDEQVAIIKDKQTISDFLDLKTVEATETDIVIKSNCVYGNIEHTNPIDFLETYGF